MQSDRTLPRRDFLKIGSGVLTGVLAAGSPFALLAPSRVWAVDLSSLTSEEGSALMAVSRTIAPHDRLEDAAYALVIQSIDAEAGRDPGLLALLRAGINGLGREFAAAAETDRVAALKRIEQTEFFQTVRAKTLQLLYASPLAYSYFGYEGESFSRGGYLFRGFDDLRWLPEVPEADAGPVPGRTPAAEA